MFITPALLHQIKSCYDIRSTKLTVEDAYLFGRAFGSELIERGKKTTVIGYDRRKNSKNLHDHFVQGLLESGIHVFSIGQTTTPMIQIAEFALNVDSAVSITASHNPLEYLGIKLFLERHSFADSNLAILVSRILKHDFKSGAGKLEYMNFHQEYARILEEHIQIEGKFRIGWDLLYATSADVFPYITHLLKGSHYVLNHRKDQEFGGFAPDPTYEPRMTELKELIIEKNLDFGIALDGDCDRCIIFDKNGKIVPGDALLALLAYFTHKLEGKDVKMIWDSKSSNLFIRWAKFAQSQISVTGHSNLYNLLRKTNADIGGECSGHYMFSSYFGINDGIYTALRFINNLEKMNMTIEEALNVLPTIWISESLSIPCLNEDKEEVIRQIVSLLSRQDITMDLSDGVKACYAYGWWMIRPSRTEPILRISAEGWTEEGLERIKEQVKTVLSSINYGSR